MPSLSDKLKSLGVKVGAQGLPPPQPRNPYSIEKVLDGRIITNQIGETFLVESWYPASYQHGRASIQIVAPLEKIAEWAGDARIKGMSPQSFAYIDTESTGLMGGAGTYAFLVGIGRFEGDNFHLAQFFMRDPLEEPAQLFALEEFLAPCEGLVTFNGKTFDLPLLTSRFITQGWRPPFGNLAHVDLLHLARRLWRDRLPNRALASLEVEILGATRTEEDIPGWLIPSVYFEYLRDGDARRMKNVFYHNAMDVVSMTALFNHMAGLLSDPLDSRIEHGVDIISLGKLFEDLGDIDRAAHLYLYGLERDLPKAALLEAIQRLAAIHKHRDNLTAAVELWEEAAHHQHLHSHLELAKFYEHQLRDYSKALTWTDSAIEIVADPEFPIFERHQWLPDLEHRRNRLLRKLTIHDDRPRQDE